MITMLAIVLAGSGLARGSTLAAAPQKWPAVGVQGSVTSWRLELVDIRPMNRIPNTTWKNYATNKWKFWVLHLRMTNTGHRASSISDDLEITLRILPQYQSSPPSPGWTQVGPNDTGLRPLILAATRQFGGALSWQVTQPGKTTLYCYLIGSKRGESHYGLYNATPKGFVFLFDTGY
jgi:hypothetical protein